MNVLRLRCEPAPARWGGVVNPLAFRIARRYLCLTWGKVAFTWGSEFSRLPIEHIAHRGRFSRFNPGVNMVANRDVSGREIRELIAGRIKEARLAADMTQTDVAQLMNVSRVSYTIMESGRRSVPAEIILQMAKIFEVNPLYLLGQAPDMLAADDPKLLLAIREIQKLKPADLVEILDVFVKLGQDSAGKPPTRIYHRTNKNRRSIKPEN